MADVIKKSTNKFTKGLVMDFSPENTRNEVLTHALNATLLTFNGNELALQNDMGNARVETAFLPEGYIPVGTCEYGGIIYIVSYNPLEDKSQIGCFPSPERNVSNDELGKSDAVIESNYFQDTINGILTGRIKNNSQCVLLKEDSLNPGDKFLVCAEGSIFNEKLADLYRQSEDEPMSPIENPVLALHVVSIEDSGKIIYLNSDLRKYQVQREDALYSYHILGQDPEEGKAFDQAAIDIESYRNVLSSGFNVFKTKTSGRLALLAELIMIDSYSVTHSVVPSRDLNGNTIAGSFDVIVHTEVTPDLNSDNFATAPKLAYYYLQDSQGYLAYASTDSQTGVAYKPLFIKNKFNSNFFSTRLADIYEPSADINLIGKVSDTGKFMFSSPNTYYGKMINYQGDITEDAGLYTFFTASCYHRINTSQVRSNIEYYRDDLKATVYKYDPEDSDYVALKSDEPLVDGVTYYTKQITKRYEDAKRKGTMEDVFFERRDEPDRADNVEKEASYIQKYMKIESTHYIKVEDFTNVPLDSLFTKDPEIENKYNSIGSNTQLDPNVDYYQETKLVAYVPVTQSYVASHINDTFYWYSDEPKYRAVSNEVKKEYLSDYPYPFDKAGAPWGYAKVLYKCIEEPGYIPATEEDLANYHKSQSVKLYYKVYFKKVEWTSLPSVDDKQHFIVMYRDTYVPYNKFIPSSSYNYIFPYSQAISEPNYSLLYGSQYDAPLYLYTKADFIPQKSEISPDVYEITQYEDVKLGTLKLPSVAATNNLDLPFKYTYTLVPCMNYGKLDHLAVSNTVDFSQLHAFNNSKFTSWKYHIDGTQLRLTFGAEIFDSFETDKVDAIILEFYDLWGFAGSLEITGKKSYSGTFTKILTLNAPNALSKNKIHNNEYIDTYTRNINIKPSGQNFILNNRSLYWDNQRGWRVSEAENDCGTLYPNVLYGVKTYLRQTTSTGYKFTPKKNMFLYTIPILNDYYYTVNDFNTIENPTLDLMLTYKLTDSSRVQPYNSSTIEDGYLIGEESQAVRDYLKGMYKDSSLSGTKYYQYSGKSNLCLEIGLKQEYQDFGLSYTSDINDIFSCELQLVSDDDRNKTFNIKVGETINNAALNYTEASNLSLQSNSLLFNGNSSTYTIAPGEFSNYNFINGETRRTIPINYSFIVGYPFTVASIRATEVPTTTICALFHKDDQGRYNLDDFGLHNLSEDASTTKYLSKAMFANAGTAGTEVFGVVQHVATEGNASLQYKASEWHSQDSKWWSGITNSKKLNTGNPLKTMSKYIGKLTFMQPHAHNNDSNADNGVNIRYEADGGYWTVVSDAAAGWYVGSKSNYDDCYGSIPYDQWYYNPHYNMSVNTIKSMNTYDEFISTLDYIPTVGFIEGFDINDYGKDGYWDTHEYWYNQPMRQFTGFSGAELEVFYEKFVKTMKSIYAYNSDYPQVSVQTGTATVSDNPVAFTSNLISKNAQLHFEEGTSFNDYIYLGPISWKEYLQYIQTYSEGSDSGIRTFTTDSNGNEVPVAAVNLNPSYTYLGSDTSLYLVTSLTYNTQTPADLAERLEIKLGNSTCVKHEDGSYSFISGIPNKNLLYTFDKSNTKLVQLDVSNYTIAEDGTLNLREVVKAGSASISVPVTSDVFSKLLGDGYKFTYEFISNDSGASNVDLVLKMIPDPTYASSVVDSDTCTLYFVTELNNGAMVFNDDIVTVEPTQDGYTYPNACITHGALMSATNVDIRSVGLMPTGISQPEWLKQPKEVLNALLFGDSEESLQITFDANGVSQTITGTVEDLRVASNIETNLETNVLTVTSTNTCDYYLTAVTFKQIPISLERQMQYKLTTGDIVYVTPTKQYSDTPDHRYILLSDPSVNYNQARIRGTSIVINDLYFDALSTGHRLYMKSDKYFYDDVPKYRGKIYYRSRSSWSTWSFYDRNGKGVRRGSSDYRNANNLWLHTGPCFTLDNLNHCAYDDE